MNPEWNQQIKDRVRQNQVDRLRNELLNPKIPLQSRIDEIRKMGGTRFWRFLGFDRMYDYLRYDLQLSPDQARTLTWEAIQNGHEEPDERIGC